MKKLLPIIGAVVALQTSGCATTGSWNLLDTYTDNVKEDRRSGRTDYLEQAQRQEEARNRLEGIELEQAAQEETFSRHRREHEVERARHERREREMERKKFLDDIFHP